jgi:hypothetical protein
MTRPRGRCPGCGEEHALRPDGRMWGHGNHDGYTYTPCGEDMLPMTPEQCEQWDETERTKQAERRAAWEQRERERVKEQLATTRYAFRAFDEESFAACPFQSPRVAFIAVASDGPVTFAVTVTEKRDLLRSDFLVLVAWPGEWSQHIFLLTEQDKTAVLAAITP